MSPGAIIQNRVSTVSKSRPGAPGQRQAAGRGRRRITDVEEHPRGGSAQHDQTTTNFSSWAKRREVEGPAAAVSGIVVSQVSKSKRDMGHPAHRGTYMNSNSSVIPAKPKETDLLVPFEIQNIPPQYREYYAIKRNNFFASVQWVREIWNYYLMLDEVWMREFDDLETATDRNLMFPLLLYFNAHAKMRVSIELALSGCLAEARSILRDAIEFVAHAHAMCNDSALQKVWLSKNDGTAALKAFENAFEHHKKSGLFKGLPELHRIWGELSETGSHANISAMSDRFVHITTDKHVEFRLKYSGADPKTWTLMLFGMLLTCSTMEQTLFSDYDGRLKLDIELMQMRAKCDEYKEWLRERLKTQFNIPPPGGIHQPKPTIYRP
jgi:hypothetical protein